MEIKILISSYNSGEVDIASGIIAIETAMDMMNKNMFNEAIQMLKPRYVPLF